jgi:hypothetical protein
VIWHVAPSCRGKHAFFTEIAEAEKINTSYFSRIPRLAQLAAALSRPSSAAGRDERAMLERLEKPLLVG